MSTQVTSNNLFLNQTIELKTPKSPEQDNLKVNGEDYNSKTDNLIFSADSERTVLYNFEKTSLNAIQDSKLKLEENASEIEEAIEVIADFMKVTTQNVNFYKDETSDKTVIKVFDGESKDLIKQFPSEEFLDIANKILALRQDIGLKTGILLDEQV
jgi:flagellar protein FlaG